jgi:adenosine kinase
VSRRVAVIGTINHDRIISPSGEVHEDLGGILYNVLTLAPFLDPDDLLVPIARVGAERREEIEALLAPYDCIDPSHLLWWPGGTNETVLRYVTPDVREETLIERIVPLADEELRAASACDVVLVNLVWGRELEPAQIRLIAGRETMLLLDIQSLTLTFRGGGDRAYRNIPAWREWAEKADVLKGSEEELRWFAGENGPLPGDLQGVMAEILEAGPEMVLATKGAAGSTVVWREGGRLRSAEVPPLPVAEEELVDSTGCGDAYASGFALGLLESEGALEAALLGSTLAGLVCQSRGLRALRGLPDPFTLRREAYRDFLGRIARRGVRAARGSSRPRPEGTAER